MFPIVLTPKFTKILMVGDGPTAEKRATQLMNASLCIRRFTKTPPSENEIKAAHIVYIVDYPQDEAVKIADLCRKHATLVNIEDDLPYCDFHTPALVRRGDLLISISTNGKSPGLAIRIKRHLEKLFPESWAEKLDKIAKMRLEWRAQGLGMKEVAEKTGEVIDREGWLEDAGRGQ